MSEPMKLKYTSEQFQKLLNQFQSAVDSGEYTEKIPYETWRKLQKRTEPTIIEYVSPFVRIKSCFVHMDGSETWDIIYSAKTYDWGFGRFFYDFVVKKENERMTLNSATSATSACDAVGAKASALEAKADYMGASDVAYATALTGKLAYDNNGYSYYGTDSTSTAKIAEPNRTNTIELNIPSLDHFGYHQIDGTWDSVASKSEMEDRFKKLEAELQKKVDKAEKNECVKENDTIMKGINFDFGPCGNTVRMSMYGMAIQNISGEWVSYNPATQEIVNVDVFNIPDGGKYMYKMPVAISEIAIGDIVVHNRKPAFVTSISADGKSLGVVDPYAGERKDIMLTRSPFGFNFATKVISLFGAFGSAPTAEAPFGNMLPFLMMSEGNGGDIDPMFMYMMMQGQNGFMNGFNPMMMYFLMKDGAKDINPFMMAMMMNAGAVPTQVATNAVKPVEQV